MTRDEGMPRLQRTRRASPSPESFRTPRACRRRSRHFPRLTSLQSADGEIRSSTSPSILRPPACSGLSVHNWLADPSVHSSVPFSIPSVLVQAKCSSWTDTTFKTHHLCLPLWSSHTAAPQSPHSHRPSSSLAPPIICISASNEKPPLIRWPSEIIYPPPPPSAAVSSPLSPFFLHIVVPASYHHPAECFLGPALIAPLSISIWLENEWAGDGSPDSPLSEPGGSRLQAGFGLQLDLINTSVGYLDT